MSKNHKTVKRSLIPLGDKVLIQEIKTETKSKTGIILPDSINANRGSKEGKILAVGEGKFINNELVELSVQKGDVVLFGAGQKIKFENEEYYLVPECEILAKIK